MRAWLIALLCGCGGFARTDTPPIPRLVAPLSTSTVASPRPTLKFALPPSVVEPVVEVCSRRACDGMIVTATVTGNRAQPDGDLAPGVWFWRVRARSPMGAVTSAVWQLTVAAEPGAGDAHWGGGLDLDGDGLNELAVGAPLGGGAGAAGRVHVYHGTPGGPDPAQVMVLEAPDAAQFGHALASVDFDGDGFADLAVGAPSAVTPSGTTGAVHIYRGGPGGIGPTPDFELYAEVGDDFGWSVDQAGDVNGDGFGDLVVGAPTTVVGGRMSGMAYIYFGGPQQGALLAPLKPETAERAAVGVSVAGGGDLDGDGFDDVLVAAPNTPTTELRGRVWLFRGSAAGSAEASPAVEVGSPPFSLFGLGLAIVPDRDGDGRVDLAVGAPGDGPGRVHLFHGAAALTLLETLSGPDGDGSRFGASLASADLDGDGRGDLAIGAPCVPPGPSCPGAAYLFTGGALRLLAAPDGVPGWGISLSLADRDGDGRADLTVGSSEADATLGRVDWFRGPPIPDKPDRTLSGSDPSGRYGYVVR